MATLENATNQLAAWEAASTALATASSYQLPGGRSLTRANADEVLKMIAYWRREVQQLTALASGARDGRHKVARFVL